MSPLLWTAIGVALAALELVVPGIFLIWFGGAALATALAAWLSGGWPPMTELALFTVLSAVAIGAAIAYARWKPAAAEPNDVNDRAGQLVGRVVTLGDPIVNGQGRVFIGDTLWRVEGPDRPAGASMTVAGHRGMILLLRDAGGEASQER
ncbi:membrane protein implicated in regulation of membrane protease activity [Azospirillum agricola]|uniref:NfeD family protein n=1 Tax=Azospirillum agricola TaxID=1720247 RepID=UPI001AE51D3D|nr:NfeD family protein [Azospirillum agricola]MBP2233216.1 membrane protein implicated in regulation of membrane protease activity [Azospirillum agricola]